MITDFLHLKAPGNWINDPNGFLYFHGAYHLFYQHFPYAPRWGTMHWGHAVSHDLVHWTHLGIALFPSKAYDRNGVFSGSALELDGKLHLYYSAVRYLAEEPEDIHVAPAGQFVTSQVMITSEDGKTFDNWSKQQIIPVLSDPALGDPANTRDPKVWASNGSYYMILGSTAQGQGKVLFYRSGDGTHWHYANSYTDPSFGSMLECPDLFPLGSSYLLVGSPMGVIQDGLPYADQTMYAPADFAEDTCTLRLLAPFTYLDWGLDLYAPQSTLDDQGRRVLIGWMRMPQAVRGEADGRGPWRGMMSLPRVVEWENGHVFFRPHPQVTAQFTQPVSSPRPTVPLRIQAVLQEGQSLDLFGYRISRENGTVTADRSQVLDGLSGYRLTASTPPISAPRCPLEIYVEPNLVEIFVNHGQYVISHVVYGLRGSCSGPIDDMTTVS